MGGSGSGGSGSGGSGGGSAPTPAQIAAQLVPSGKGAKLATLLKHAGVALVFEMAERGTMVIEWFVTPKPAHGKKAKPVLIATGHATASGIQSVTVPMHLTAAGKRLLKGAKQIKVTADATFTPTSGAPVKATRTFQLRR